MWLAAWKFCSENELIGYSDTLVDLNPPHTQITVDETLPSILCDETIPGSPSTVADTLLDDDETIPDTQLSSTVADTLHDDDDDDLTSVSVAIDVDVVVVDDDEDDIEMGAA